MKNAAIPSANLIQVAKEVITLRAEVNRLRPIVLAIQTRLLQEIELLDSDGNRITNPKNAWLMDDRFVDIYYPALSKAYRDAGFDIPADFCPLLMAEEAERQAIRKMNEMAMELIPAAQRFDVSKVYNLEDWHKLTGLNLAYISQFFGK